MLPRALALWLDLLMTITIRPNSTASKTGKGSPIQRMPSSKFVLGRTAFKKLSAVEGVCVSKSLDADLNDLADATSE